MKIRYIQRTADRQGFRMCAMTAISFNLGYQPLTDTPKEVDPGLAAFVCLLNDRANDKARSLLIPRLGKIPHTGRTDLAQLIARVLIPRACEVYKYPEEAETIRGMNDEAEGLMTVASRFTKPDGMHVLASACMAMSAALEEGRDPTATDLLAVSAAGEIVMFETGQFWFESLQILDYVLGIQRHPQAEEAWLSLNHYKYFGGRDPFENVETRTAH